MSRRRVDNQNTEENIITNNETENTLEENVETIEPIEEDKITGLEAKEVVIDEPVEELKKEYKVGAKVKVKSYVSNDIIGRRIHNGIKNYVYTIIAVRPDKHCTIECLTYQFTLANDDLELQ